MDDRLLTLDEAAELLRTTRRNVRDWLWLGKLRGVKVGKAWRVPSSAIEEFLHPPPRPDPLAPINQAIAEEGECTRASEKDQHQRDTQGRPWIPPLLPE